MMALSVMTDGIERSHTRSAATPKRGKKTRISWKSSKNTSVKRPSDTEIDEQFDLGSGNLGLIFKRVFGEA